MSKHQPRGALLALATLGAVGTATATGPGTSAVAADTQLTGGVPDSARVASYVGALQPNGWYCGPAATRIALSSQGRLPSFDDLAKDLGTTMAGTDSIYDVTRVLNYNYGYERYRSVPIGNRKATGDQVKALRSDIVKSINLGDPVVANVAGTVYDTIGEVHSYPGGHYLDITGYTEGGELISITDPADAIGSNEYQVPIGVLADWIATRGYTYRIN
jgi:hypothetical protein